MKTKPDQLVCLDLFSGVGGIALGMEMAGMRTAVGVDLDPHAIDTFNKNFGPLGALGTVGNLEERDTYARVISAARSAGVNVVVGGPPCQGFSQVGNHRDLENDPRNRLYKCFVETLREIRPRAFMMENVPGLAQRANGTVMEKIKASLSLDGDYLVSAGVLDAADFGVPQSRRRFIFLGFRKDQGISPSLPIPPVRLLDFVSLERKKNGAAYKYELKSVGRTRQGDLFSSEAHNDPLEMLLDPDEPRFVTAKQALSDLEHLSPSVTLRQQSGDDWGEYNAPPSSAYQRLMRSKTNGKFYNAQVPFMWDDTKERLQRVPQGGNYRDLPEPMQRRYLNGQKWGPETGKEILSRKYFFAYRRLYENFVSWTLNTKADSVYHYDGKRALSVREFARLSSFPDHFEIVGPDKHTRYRLIGNAVPPLLARAIGEQMIALMAGGVRSGRSSR